MNGFEIFPLLSFLILTSLISGRIIFLKRKGVKVSASSGKKDKTTVFLYPVFLLILFLWIWEIAKSLFQISVSILPESITHHLIESVFLKIAAILVISISLLLLLLTLIHFKNSLRFGMDEKNLGKLVTTGIFSVSRNPFFLSLDLYFMGIAILLPSMFFIGFAILTLVSIHFFILKEEKFMRNVYGDEYLEYYRKVRRYF